MTHSSSQDIKFARIEEEFSGHCTIQQRPVAFAFNSPKLQSDIVSVQILICPEKQCFSLENILCQAVISYSESANYTDLHFNIHYTDQINEWRFIILKTSSHGMYVITVPVL